MDFRLFEEKLLSGAPSCLAASPQNQRVALVLLSSGCSSVESHPSRQADTALCLQTMFQSISAVLEAVSRAMSTQRDSQPWEGVWDELWEARMEQGWIRVGFQQLSHSRSVSILSHSILPLSL